MTVNGASSSNLSSLYNNPNMISGLASGLDTEGMIESLVQSYSQKISGINQKITTTEWQQEAYRSIIAKMSDFTDKYTSYASSTNLLSKSFFTAATKVVPQGKYADYVTATGKSSSEITLNSVSQLASSARWATSGCFGSQAGSVVGSAAIDFAGEKTLGVLDGTLSLTYGDQTIDLRFDDVSDANLTDRQALVDAINEKLKGQNVTASKQEYKASEVMQAKLEDDGSISLGLIGGFSGKFYISNASGTLGKELGLDGTLGVDTTSFTTDKTDFTVTKTIAEYISEASMTVNFNGSSKTFKLPKVEDLGNGSFSVNGGAATSDIKTAYANALNESLAAEFGAGKLTASFDNAGKLTIAGTASTDQISIQSGVSKELGLGDATTSYIDTNKTLEQLGINLDTSANYYEGDGKFAFTINGELIGSYTKDTKLSTILNDINNNSKAGVNVSFSKLTNNFVFTTKETGANQKIEVENGSFAAALFGTVKAEDYTAGKDAEFKVTVNGSDEITLKRSSNTVDLDGMSLTLKKTFTPASADDAVSFAMTTNSDSIVNAIKSMVNDYNTMMTEVKKAYRTMPLRKSDGTRYEPLTEADMEDMSESSIERYEEKAKTGLLFGDNNLSSLYEKLEFVFAPGGKDGELLQKMGITITNSATDNSMSVTVDETKLREMLASDPDAVADVFTRSSSGSDGGVMQKMKTQMDIYGRTTGATKGILVQHAGTPLSALSMLNNSLQTKIDDYNAEVAKWQSKLSTKIDYYTKQFSRLETMISQMNSQSSALAGLMGGY